MLHCLAALPRTPSVFLRASRCSETIACSRSIPRRHRPRAGEALVHFLNFFRLVMNRARFSPKLLDAVTYVSNLRFGRLILQVV